MDICPGSSRTAWMPSTSLRLFRSTSRSSSLVAFLSRLHYIFCPRVAWHEDHQQGRHHDPSGQQKNLLNSIPGQGDEDPPHFQDGPSFRGAAKYPSHLARGLEGAGDHHAGGHHHHAHLLQPPLCFWTKRSSCKVLVSLLMISYQGLPAPGTVLAPHNFPYIWPYSGSRLFYDCIMWSLLTLSTVGYHLQPQVQIYQVYFFPPDNNGPATMRPVCHLWDDDHHCADTNAGQ